jgi:D-glycero-alpha-D-manno-heptose-7-phosphate kinase
VVINAAISRYVQVDVLPGDKGILLAAEDLGARARYSSSRELRYDGKLDLHKAALNMLPVTGGVEVISQSQVPKGSGLGASGALDVALIAALARARGEWYDPTELAELGFHLEHVELKQLGGRQDQYASALGGFHEMSFGSLGVVPKPLAISLEQATDLQGHLVLVYTGESHFSSDTHRRVWTAYHEGRPDVLDALRSMKDIAVAMRPRIEAGDWRDVARLMDQNWYEQQRLDATMSTNVTQQVERVARQSGAWGVKAMGAGAGGCLIALVPPTHRPTLVETVRAAGGSVMDMAFDFDGVTSWEEADASDDPG